MLLSAIKLFCGLNNPIKNMRGDIMKSRKVAAFFALIIGVGMIALWVMLIITKQVEEFQNIPYEITMHLCGEFMTAVLLIIASVLIFAKSERGQNMFNIASGALLYTVIVSSGYYMQRNEYSMVIMFTVILLFTLFLLILTNSKNKKDKNNAQ